MNEKPCFLIHPQFSILNGNHDFICIVMAMATMNRIIISLIFLIMISMILPSSAIMYASGSTDNSDSSSDSGSTDNNADLSTTSAENNTTLPSESTLSNNTGSVQGEDLVSIILTLHNQERAAVGVPPLTWSDTLAAHAQPWADKVYATSDASHSSGLADFGNYGENMAWGGGPSFATQTWLAQTWADEKS